MHNKKTNPRNLQNQIIALCILMLVNIATFIGMSSPTYANDSIRVGLTVSKLDRGKDPVTAPLVGTSTVLTSSTGTNPSQFGQSVIFTATVTPGSAIGVMTFSFDSGGSVTQTVSSGQAVYMTSTLPVGGRLVNANFNGNSSSGNSSDSITQIVNQATTTTTLGSSPNPSIYGQSVVLTATVSADYLTPTGTVTFTFDSSISVTRTLSGGVATLITSTLDVGARSVTANYAGTESFLGSISSTMTQTVNQATTTTSIVSAPNPSIYGQGVTLTATVSANAPSTITPTGTVTFTLDSTTLTQTLNDGKATIVTSTLIAATHPVTATYSGTGSFSSSSSSLPTQIVNPANTSTSVFASPPNPVQVGSKVYFTVTVTSSTSAVTPTGSVFLTIPGNIVIDLPLNSNGQAFLAPTINSSGTFTVSASYPGDTSDSNFNASQGNLPGGLQVKDNSSTTVTASPNPSVYGQSVTITATVTGSSGTPTGIVTFTVDSTTLTRTLSGGVATYVTNTLPANNGITHTVGAQYGGDSSYKSSSSTLSGGLLVNRAQTAALITNASALMATPSSVGVGYAVNYTVTVTSPGTTAIPTGTVTVSDTTNNCQASVATATCTLTSMTAGVKNITASYPGNSNFLPSVSTGVSHTVTSNVFLPIILSNYLKPTPGLWQGTDYFTVTNPSTVVNFTSLWNWSGCTGTFTTIAPGPIPINFSKFSFTGAYSATVTFSSATHATGLVQLINYNFPGCGIKTAGPFPVTVDWFSSSAPTRLYPLSPTIRRELR